MREEDQRVRRKTLLAVHITQTECESHPGHSGERPFNKIYDFLAIGSLNSVLGRYNSMPFSTTDKDNDNHPNISCADIYGPGWHWSYYRNKVIDCYDPEVNLFGEYSPQNKGNSKANLFYASFDRPIKYIEMKIRYNYGK